MTRREQVKPTSLSGTQAMQGSQESVMKDLEGPTQLSSPPNSEGNFSPPSGIAQLTGAGAVGWCHHGVSRCRARTSSTLTPTFAEPPSSRWALGDLFQMTHSAR